MSAPNSEQQICIACGICCDNTLFDIVIIQKDEYVDDHFTDNEIEQEGERYFRLPCPYFNKCCTIYDQRKPKRCSEFRCELLKSIEHRKLTNEEAKKIVAEVKALRDAIVEKYAALTGEKLSFREISKKIEQAEIDKEVLSDELISLNYEINLLKIHLTKWFRSQKEFERLYEME